MTSTARVRVSPGTARDDVEDRALEIRRGREHALAHRRRGGHGRDQLRIADVAAGAGGRRLGAVAEVGPGIPRRRQPAPSTQAQTERYWRQRTRVPSCVAALQTASVLRSHVPTTRPTTRSGADGAGWTTPARARWPTTARTASSSPSDASSLRCRLYRGGDPSAERTTLRATAFSRSSPTAERSMKKTCRPLSRPVANSSAARGLAVASGAAGLLVVGLDAARDAEWTTSRMSALSTPIPNALVATRPATLAGHEAPLARSRGVARAAPRGRRRPRRPARGQAIREPLGFVARAGVDDRRQRLGLRERRARSAGARAALFAHATTANERFGRSKPGAPRAPARAGRAGDTMSARTSGVAVAVEREDRLGARAARRVGQPEVLGPEVVAPLRDAVRLVDREQAIRVRGCAPGSPGGEPLGRDVEQPYLAATACSTASRFVRASCWALTSADAAGRDRAAAPRPGPASARSAARRRASGPSASAPAAGSRATCPRRSASPPARRGRPWRPRPPRAARAGSPGKPKSSFIAPSTAAADATGTRGTRPSAAPRSNDVWWEPGVLRARRATRVGDLPPAPVAPRGAHSLSQIRVRFVRTQRSEREIPDAEVVVRRRRRRPPNAPSRPCPTRAGRPGPARRSRGRLAPRAARASGSVSVVAARSRR